METVTWGRWEAELGIGRRGSWHSNTLRSAGRCEDCGNGGAGWFATEGSGCCFVSLNELGGDARVCRKFVASDGSGLIESTAELGAWSDSLHIVR